MVQIELMKMPESKYKIKCPYPMTPVEIAVHNTANNASARSEISYMINNNYSTSYHYAVDEKRVVQGVPLDRNAWHAGDSTSGRGNRKAISIEICRSTGNQEDFIKAENNAIELIVMLLKACGWGIEKVKKHQDYSGKYCPHKTLDLGWERFIKKVVDKMNEQTKNEVPAWAKAELEEAQKLGITDGTRPNDKATRVEVAVMQVRTYKKIMEDLKKGGN